MNQNVINYLQENKDKFSQSVLVDQLKASGYAEADIAEGVMQVYGSAAPAVAPAPTAQVKYAGFWIRWVANFVDGIILQIIGFIAGLILGIILGISGAGKSAPLAGGIAGLVIGWAYFVVMTKKYGSTLGKMAVGVKVVSDKSESLSWGQLILRETIGKIISAIILLIGYIMAGFTERKQALHDMMAGTLVVYKDPNKKTPIWIFIVALVIPVIAILGILASIVLVSLSSARDKAQDAGMKASISSAITAAIIYQDEKGTLKGFDPKLNIRAQACTGTPIVNISPDGKNMAIFAKLCSGSKNYFCDDLDSNAIEVDEAYAKSGASVCDANSVSSLSTSDTKNATSQSSLTNTFRDTSSKYEMKYPNSWVLEEDKEANLSSFTSEDGNHNIIVGIISNKDASFVEAVDRFKKVCAIRKGTGKIYDEKDFIYNLNGKNIEGKQLKSDCTLSDSAFRNWVVILPYKFDNYTWIYTSSPDNFTTGITGEIIDTFKLLD